MACRLTLLILIKKSDAQFGALTFPSIENLPRPTTWGPLFIEAHALSRFQTEKEEKETKNKRT